MSELKLDRNNTSFVLQLFEYFKQLKTDEKYGFLKYYQNIVRSFVNDVNLDSRGLLIYQTMGLGKSILAISIAMDMMSKLQPIILLTKSLQENMTNAIKKYVALRAKFEPDYHLAHLSDDQLNLWIKKNFSFVSMNASNMLKQMSKAAEGRATEEFDAALEKKFGEIVKLASLDNKLLIVDEAHNLFRAITNGSKNAHGLYDMVMKAKNLKVMFFTGTPIANDPFELVPCFNMLGSKRGVSILPETYSDFNKLFVDASGKIKNKEIFQNRLFGLVSYVSHHSTPGKKLGIDDVTTKAEFPEERAVVVERVHMDPDQYSMYGLARDKEKEEGTGTGFGGPRRPVEAPALTKPKGKPSSTYRVKSRQLSNFCPPEGHRDEKDPARIPENNLGSAKFRKMYQNIQKHDGQIGIVYSQFIGVGGLGTFARFLQSNGWKQIQLGSRAPAGEFIDVAEFSGEWEGGSWVPSADRIIEEIEENARTGAADSEYNIFGGNSANWWEDSGEIFGGDGAKQFAIISGDVSIEDRTLIQNMYNQESNMHGGVIDLILLSSTGAEGLDLKNTRHIHIMEPYWNWGRIKQIIARGVRNDSHIMLPKEEKNVTPYIYLAIPPESEKLPDGTYPDTTDTELYNESITNQNVIDSFHDALKEVSIECIVNDEAFCKTCAPTDSKLYGDIYQDVKLPDPCVSVREETVKAQKITIGENEYYYKDDPSSIFDYAVFEFDKKTSTYKPIKESDSRFAEIIEQITSKQ